MTGAFPAPPPPWEMRTGPTKLIHQVLDVYSGQARIALDRPRMIHYVKKPGEAFSEIFVLHESRWMNFSLCTRKELVCTDHSHLFFQALDIVTLRISRQF